MQNTTNNSNTMNVTNVSNTIIVDGETYTEGQVRALIDCKRQLIGLEEAINYNYEYEMAQDIKDYIERNFEQSEIIEKLAWNDRSDWQDELYDELFNEDAITGNASGSYTRNSYRAGLYLLRNMDLYEEACSEFGGEPNGAFSSETADVMIRCYILGNVISEVLSDMEDELSNEIEEYENREDEETEETEE